METITFQRLSKYIISNLGERFQENIPKVLALVMSYVEKVAPSLSLSSDEKHQLCLEWLKKLIPSLTDTELGLMSDTIDIIILATKNIFDINKKQPPMTMKTPEGVITVPQAVPQTVPKKTLFRQKSTYNLKPTCLDGQESI